MGRRRIGGFADLDGLEFIARIDLGTDTNGEAKNEIRGAVTPDHKGYSQAMGQHAAPGGYAGPAAYAGPPQGFVLKGTLPSGGRRFLCA